MISMTARIGRIYARYSEYQHLLIILLSLYLILTSSWLLMGRSIRENASLWDITHVYLGLFTTLLACLFLLANSIRGKWHQYFPWLLGNTTQLVNDCKGVFKGKIPVSGGRGLFSCVEGIGMLLLVGVGLTGTLWFVSQGSTDALLWRNYHIILAKGFIGFIVIHIIFACLHLLDFIRN
ncbi:cytochrome b/b6 domain-containing protein [Shewanella sp. D64]|uniref:cytochrome b/b6 domain-containing protein n=1 Tax=unclassified Shewanella TaxID=196818 RepID=UPI0022BA2093|nr:MULTISPECIES: cytochrome b/b6 domain-containing protein [unclassified Shewanella]MEC4727480.1 cytochrome b/b6 domain-containing protein [Shewanella sp. D64]MEC4738111.1 cytochrome b/b6 domain-containing protein [Shewanella sp. E94]WBJ96375.1 cytochrome b/b6 domain-containing protein [Shewanella sp. MTB7]